MSAETSVSMVELNLRVSVCPGPTGDTLAALKKLSPGDRLAVITDYPAVRLSGGSGHPALTGETPWM